MVSILPKTVFQFVRVKFPEESMLLPTSILKDVERMVANGIRITMTANRDTRIVSGIRHLRRSTIAGLTDLPDTVIYCFFASTTSDRKRIKIATPEKKAAAVKEPEEKKAAEPQPVVASVQEAENARYAEIRAFLTGLFDKMGIDAQIDISTRENGSIDVELSGNGMGAIIGRRGETLDAIQHLTNYVCNHGGKEFSYGNSSYLSPEKASAQQGSRFPCQNEDCERPQSPVCTQGKGQSNSQRLSVCFHYREYITAVIRVE